VTQAPRYRTTFVRLLGFLRPYKWSTAISVVLAIGSQAAALIGVYLTGSVANALTNNEHSAA
jgi:ABC-type multidrug transport system fused ATPase/permease subunit